MKSLIKAISNPKVIVTLFLLFAIMAGMQSYLQPEGSFVVDGGHYSPFNNYVIFKTSFTHLVHNQDLYQAYPQEYWDLYKYSPTFSMFFAPFTILPDAIGLNLWNIINALILLLAIYYLPLFNAKQKGLILLICLLELTTSMQNQQSNGLMAGLIILTFGLLEKRNYLLATFCIVFSIYIKLFGVVGLVLFLFYPQKWRLALYTLAWTLLLFALPLLAISFGQLKFLYASWKHLIDSDLSASYGYSVIGWLHSWFGAEFNKQIIVITAAMLFILPFFRFRQYKYFAFRMLALASLLIWIVIFNPKAESPTFIIAMAGVAIWFFAGKKNNLNIILFVAAFVLTSLSPTDLFPRYLREEFVKPYNLKVFPCILIWLKIVYDMIVFRANKIEAESEVRIINE
jgi:hypothetical protein